MGALPRLIRSDDATPRRPDRPGARHHHQADDQGTPDMDTKQARRLAIAIEEATRKARQVGGYATVYRAASYFLVEGHDTPQPPRGGIIHGTYDAAGRDILESAEGAGLVETPRPGRRYLHAYTYRGQPSPVMTTRILDDGRIEVRNERTGNVTALDRGTRLPPAPEAPRRRQTGRERQTPTSAPATG